MVELSKLSRKAAKTAQCMLSSGVAHTVGLRLDGTVMAVGENDFGQCNVSDWQEIVAVTAGSSHTVGIKSNGTVVSTVPYDDVSAWREILSVAAYLHTVGLKSDGTVVAVGNNTYGECNVSGWKNIIDVAVGERHTVGLKSDGTPVAVGDNSCGQCDVSGWRNIVAVGAGTFFTVGLKSDGTLVAVGSLGHRRDDGTVIPGDPSIIGVGCDDRCQYDVSSWKDIISIDVGYLDIVGLHPDGTVVTIGLHTKETANPDIKIQVADWCHMATVSVGLQHAVGLRMDGTIIATGKNEQGQCNISGWRLCQDINTLEEERRQIKAQREKQCRYIASVRNRIGAASRFIAAGINHVVALKLDGTVIAFGENSVGQCNVSGWKNIIAVAAYEGLSVGLKSDGTVVTAGNVYFDGRRNCDTSDWTDIVRIAAVSDSSISSDGCVIGWKPDGSILSTDPRIQDAVFNQTDIVSLSKYNNKILCLKSNGIITGESAVSKMKNIMTISAGTYQNGHIVCLKNDGTVSAIGNNEFGQCNVSGWKNIVDISAYGGYTAGLKADGTVAVLGPPVVISSMQDISEWTDIAAIAIGGHFIVALKIDGTVVACGHNKWGQCNVSGIRLFHSLDTLEEDLQRVRIQKQEEIKRLEARHKEIEAQRQAEEEEAARRRETAHEQAVMKAKQRIKELEREQKDIYKELENTHGIFSGKKRQQLQNKLDSIDKEIKCLQDL